MTPKEKAKELVNKFMHPVRWKLGQEDVKERAIECALIAVDELIAADWYIPTSEDLNKWTSYWEEVKNEIEKL